MTIKEKLVQIATANSFASSPHAIYAEAEINAIRCDKCRHWATVEQIGGYMGGYRACRNDTQNPLALLRGTATKPDFFCALWEAK